MKSLIRGHRAYQGGRPRTGTQLLVSALSLGAGRGASDELPLNSTDTVAPMALSQPWKEGGRGTTLQWEPYDLEAQGHKR